MTTAEALRMLETLRDTAAEVRATIENMQSVGANRTAREMAQGLTAFLTAAAKILDADGLK